MVYVYHAAFAQRLFVGKTYAFARDQRVYSIFTDRMYEYRQAISNKCSRRLRWQLRVLDKVGQTTGASYKRKVEILASEFDTGPGV
jgi:hypothetical protein